MKLKVGDKFVLNKKAMDEIGINISPKFTVYKIDEHGIYVKYDGIYFLISEDGIDWEETNKLNKIKMVIGENRVVKCGEYEVEWNWEDSYLKENDYSRLVVRDKNGYIISLGFNKYNSKQQMEIANLILDKLGLNVELVEGCNEVLEQIEKLEAELKKLRGMIK